MAAVVTACAHWYPTSHNNRSKFCSTDERVITVQTKDDLEKARAKCELVATDFWECTDKNGNKWWCNHEGYLPKPRTLGTAEHLDITLSLVFVRDTETGRIVVAAPLATERKTLNKK